ncbi:hypothetical protein PR048_006279 [Dryococelus australis]|uniref:Reverse transcriptase domain-containing protein n=1 Tax=Dryococelus australis TaxID=614101 RepID=A0ABQ9IBP3_9NEOP|nr:hypothetical protein PR048_006279 [Dryococelus australis]
MDNILIHAATKEDLEANTQKVIDKLKQAGLKFNASKCTFKQYQIIFLAYILSKDRLSADPDKVAIIERIKKPMSVKELQRFLGTITYLAKFILHVYYDHTKPVTLSVEAISHSDAAMLQRNRPVCYAYDAWQSTSDKPLEVIFKKPLLDVPARLQRILFEVLLYNLTVTYKNGSELYIADALSTDCDNCPEPDAPQTVDVQVVKLMLKECRTIKLTTHHIKWMANQAQPPVQKSSEILYIQRTVGSLQQCHLQGDTDIDPRNNEVTGSLTITSCPQRYSRHSKAGKRTCFLDRMTRCHGIHEKMCHMSKYSTGPTWWN